MERFIHLFNSQSELNEAYESSGYTVPWLACVFNEDGSGSGISYNKKTQFNGYDYVDFGLTSGTLWATCNVGASSPEEVGDYFAFGETRTKSDYTEQNYRFYKSGERWPTKYNNTDYKSLLEIVDDAANVVMGGDWMVPSTEHFNELTAATNTGVTTLNGVTGVGFTSKTDSSKSIFIPYCGYKCEDVPEGEVVSDKFYFMCSNLIDDPAYSVVEGVFTNDHTTVYYGRHFGFKIRGIVSLTLDLSDYQYPVYGESEIELSRDIIKQPGIEFVTYIREPDGKIHEYYNNNSYYWRDLTPQEQRKLGSECLCFYLYGDGRIGWYVCRQIDMYHGGE